MAGVDRETPPNSKMFDPTRTQNTDDIALLAKRRLSQNRGTEQPAITVNFPGFAEIFRQPNAPAPLGPLLAHNVADNHAAPIRQAPLAPMDLENFCVQYMLSDNIKAKLESIHVAGPHVLSLISNADFRGEGQLSIGELASLRDAEMRWIHAAGGA